MLLAILRAYSDAWNLPFYYSGFLIPLTILYYHSLLPETLSPIFAININSVLLCPTSTLDLFHEACSDQP